VVPDLVTVAKGVAGGLPLAAVVGTAEMMDSVHVGGLGGTYGGNPVACAAALGAIATMKELELDKRAVAIEELLLGRLNALAETYPWIGDVRGRGAMIAIEIVEPGGTVPDAARAGLLSAGCHQAGVLTLTCGTYGNVLRFLPPLVAPDELLNEAMDVLAEVAGTLGP
jgi:4-aminobutyrate aminotransferase/(S)-3-amino-2-methylpropionate transaminase